MTPAIQPVTPAVTLMTSEEAREWLARGTSLVADAAEWYREGDEREAWRALGYGSIRECVATELRLEGHSYREIGELMGVGKTTVARDIAGVPSGTPVLPERVAGRDGKTYPAVRQAPTRDAVRRHFTSEPPTPPAFARHEGEASGAYGAAFLALRQAMFYDACVVAAELNDFEREVARRNLPGMVAWLQKLQGELA